MNSTHWIYGAEGNANLVLRYVGPDPSLKTKVLRLQKAATLAEEETPDFILEFINTVIAPLLGQNYVVPMSVVPIDPKFLKAIAIAIEPSRPKKRLQHPIDYSVPWAFLATDLTRQWHPSPTMTIELKPKWGFLPTSPLIKTAHRSIKRRQCRFCMHSQLRNPEVLHYCPMDLYSLDPARMRHALRELLLHHNQQKLRLFLDGRNVALDGVADHSDSLRAFFLQEQPNMLINSLVDLVLEILIRDPILQKLKSLQSRLDELDVEGILAFYQAHPDLPTHDISVWQNVVKRFQKRIETQPHLEQLIPEDANEKIQRLYEYVLSMTFKDCSIMISVTPHTGALTSENTIKLNNQVYVYNVKVVDIDLKKMSKIPYWFNLDQRIVEHALQHQIQRTCVE
ncbi:Inositol-pentakisphosphate 2-kinase [Apophysomyces ossiformis]|uniref:Inositol-pentakisphosphate 2-kinase n=1 Tax=Apophysomyces ossiformis TaxID=679940 RepID=A0A8H7BS15_9FUNG|nr:Inositol-pentakisphosphate 2-kinase [Apophysomyces ossiformis]